MFIMKKEIYLSSITVAFTMEHFSKDYNKEKVLEFLTQKLLGDCFYFIGSTFIRTLPKLVAPALKVEIKEAFKGEKEGEWFVLIHVNRHAGKGHSLDDDFVFRRGDYFITQTAVPFSGNVESVLNGESMEE